MIHPYSHYPARTARRWPDRVALIDGARRRSYRELDERATQLARALIHRGLLPGERVCVVQENCIEYVEMAIAIARAGGAVVPLLGALTEREHTFMLQDSEARFVVALGAEAIPRACAAVAGSDAVAMALGAGEGAEDLAALADDESNEPVSIDRAPDSLAQILYTSGTTGHPKGVTHSYASVAAAMGAWATAFAVGPEDRILACWVAGATLVIQPSADPKAMLGAIAEHKITIILAIPTLLRMLLDHPDAEQADLSSLRAVVYAAAPTAPALVRASLARLGPVLYTGFGQTEAYRGTRGRRRAPHLRGTRVRGVRPGADLRRGRQRGSDRRGGRDLCLRTVDDAGFLEASGTRSGSIARWLAPHGRSRPHGRRGLRVSRRPQGRQDHHRRFQRVPGRGRRNPRRTSRGGGVRGICGARPQVG
ncbi:MAG: AMP-binding protein [Deltaproteobacteria bacterium]|nr:AMP-binding protein [Deltaproteobacteria bacterium]